MKQSITLSSKGYGEQNHYPVEQINTTGKFNAYVWHL